MLVLCFALFPFQAEMWVPDARHQPVICRCCPLICGLLTVIQELPFHFKRKWVLVKELLGFVDLGFAVFIVRCCYFFIPTKTINLEGNCQEWLYKHKFHSLSFLDHEQ
jgi:hypothetical protein